MIDSLFRDITIVSRGTPEEAATGAACWLMDQAKRVLDDRSNLHVALCGGTSPYPLLAALLAAAEPNEAGPNQAGPNRAGSEELPAGGPPGGLGSPSSHLDPGLTTEDRSQLPGCALPAAVPRNVLERMTWWPLDERVVPLDHADSNYSGLNARFFSKLSRPNVCWFPFSPRGESSFSSGPSDFTPPRGGSGSYSASKDDESKGGRAHNPTDALALLNERFSRKEGELAIVLAGVGPDGHIASLFPQVGPSVDDFAGTRSLSGSGSFGGYSGDQEGQEPSYIEVFDSPKPPPHRITLTAQAIRSAHFTVALLFGSAKKDALAAFLDWSSRPVTCPARVLFQPADSASNGSLQQQLLIISDQSVPETALTGYPARVQFI